MLRLGAAEAARSHRLPAGAVRTAIEAALTDPTRLGRAHEAAVGGGVRSMLGLGAAEAARSHRLPAGAARTAIEAALTDPTRLGRAHEAAVGGGVRSMLGLGAAEAARSHRLPAGAVRTAIEAALTDPTRLGRAHEAAVGGGVRSMLGLGAAEAARSHRLPAGAAHTVTDCVLRQTALASSLAKLIPPKKPKGDGAISVTSATPIARYRDIASVFDPNPVPSTHALGEKAGEPIPSSPKMDPEKCETTPVIASTGSKVATFPSSVRQRTLVVAGVEFKLPAMRAPVSENGDITGYFDSQHCELLHQLEHHLRIFVEGELRRVEGSKWIRKRVSEKTKSKWEERKQEDYDRRGDSYPLIYYSDLMDLSDIVCRNDNWRDAFLPKFKNRDDFQVAMRRLNPIRHAIAHGRPLVDADQLLLSSEALRLLRALGPPF